MGEYMGYIVKQYEKKHYFDIFYSDMSLSVCMELLQPHPVHYAALHARVHQVLL